MEYNNHTNFFLFWIKYTFLFSQVPSPGEDGEDEDDMQVGLSITELSELTSIRKEDIITTMNFYEMKNYLRGEFVITLTTEMIDAHKRSTEKRPLRIDSECINYKPVDWGKHRRNN